MRITIELERPTMGRRTALFVATLLALLMPAAAFASHQFIDVATTHSFHGDISHAKGAGLTAGCSATQFCPDGPVTRGQMTAFLNRGLGRLAGASLSGSTASATPTILGTTTIKAGNVIGGGGLIQLSSFVNVSAGSGCPCEVAVSIVDAAGAVVSPVLADLPAVPSGDNDTDMVVAIVGMDTVDTGVAQTYRVEISRTLGTATVFGYGQLTATYFPFDGDGHAVTTFISSEGAVPKGE